MGTSLYEISETQSGKAESANENFEAVAVAGLFGIKRMSTAGLTFAYYGGTMKVGGVPTIIPDGTLALTDNAVNYVQANSSGVVSTYTGSPTGFQNSYTPLYKITTSGGGITEIVDYRMIQYASLP